MANVPDSPSVDREVTVFGTGISSAKARFDPNAHKETAQNPKHAGYNCYKYQYMNNLRI